MFHGGRHLDFFYEAEWNSKTPLENLAMYYYGSRSTFENIPTRLQNMISSHKTDDLGHGSTSQNDSFSASEDASVLKLQGYKNSTGASGGLPMSTGLKLGRQTYFEAAAAAKSTSCSVGPSTKRRSRQSNKQKTRCCCQVEGCKLDLVSAKGYHRRHKICETHSKSPRVIVAGMERRFCQQCSRFHDLSEFDDKKRSCRRRLSNHNARRRRPQPEAAPQFINSAQLYDPRMNFLPNNSLPIPIPIPAANRRRGTDCHLSSVPRTLLYNDASAAALEDAPSLLSSNNSWASNEREPPTSLERLVVHGNHMISLGGQAAETHSNLQNWAAASSSSMEYLLDFNTTGISTQFQHHHHHHPHAS